MAESIDSWYQRELDYLRSAGAEFASRFGKIADRLSLSATGTQDPHVERLLQGVAFLNARIRQKLDDSFPELAESLLHVLYPHMVAPIPSMSILQLELNPKQVDLVQGYVVPRQSMLESDRVEGYGAKYQTCFPVTLYPLRVENVELVSPPFPIPIGAGSREVACALHIEIAPISKTQRMSQFEFDQLRFFIDLGNYQLAAKLMELLLAHCHEIIVHSHDADGLDVNLDPTCLSQAGFAADEAILPQRAQSFAGYRLLAEHFTLREKSLFFDLSGLTPQVLAQAGDRLDLWIALTDEDDDLASAIGPDSLKLGCTPIINLYSETADAIPVSVAQSEYRIIPDARAEHVNEVYSVDQVSITDEDDTEWELLPFYSVSHTSREKPRYWYSVRRPGPQSKDAGPIDGPSEVYVSFVDEEFRLLNENRGYLQTRVTCFNRVIPEQLSRREISQIRFSFVNGAGPVSTIRCLTPPTRTIRSHLGTATLWPLVSQLALNHLSISGEQGGDALKEILKINDPRHSDQIDRLIDGLTEVASRPCIERVGTSLIRGTQIDLTLDDESFSGDSAYLFCCLLNRFLAMTSSINSFTRLTALTHAAQEKGKAPWKWTPTTGTRQLV